MAGTFHYMAPEVLRLKDPHTEAVDVWSAGVTFYELLTGTTLLAVDEDTGFSVENWTKGLGIKIERFLKEISMRCPIAKEVGRSTLKVDPNSFTVRPMFPRLTLTPHLERNVNKSVSCMSVSLPHPLFISVCFHDMEHGGSTEDA